MLRDKDVKAIFRIGLPGPGTPDDMVLTASKNGIFSVKGCYQLLNRYNTKETRYGRNFGYLHCMKGTLISMEDVIGCAPNKSSIELETGRPRNELLP